MCLYVRAHTHTHTHKSIHLKVISRLATTNIGTFSNVCNPQNNLKMQVSSKLY